MVLDFFKGNQAKMELWFKTPNPLLGGITPVDMILLGRSDKLMKFVQQQIAENE